MGDRYYPDSDLQGWRQGGNNREYPGYRMERFICCENDPDCDAPCVAHPWGTEEGEEERFRRGRGAIRMSRLLLAIGLFFGTLYIVVCLWP